MPDYPLDDLREALHARDRAEKLVIELVGEARKGGYSWERIAQVFGLARQSVWERYAGKVGE